MAEWQAITDSIRFLQAQIEAAKATVLAAYAERWIKGE